MSIKSILIIGLTVIILAGCIQAVSPVKDAVEDMNTASQKNNYLFSYFIGNGEDGLHLAYSHDGYKWKALNNKKVLLEPKLTGENIFRAFVEEEIGLTDKLDYVAALRIDKHPGMNAIFTPKLNVLYSAGMKTRLRA